MEKLYIEYRVYVNPENHADELKELAEGIKDAIWDDFDDSDDLHGQVEKITYEIIRQDFPTERGDAANDRRLAEVIFGKNWTESHTE